MCISPSLQRPLTVLREPHEFGWVAGQADPPGIAGAHSELVLAAWGQVLNDKVCVQSRGYRLLPDLRACRTEGEGGAEGNTRCVSSGLRLSLPSLGGTLGG